MSEPIESDEVEGLKSPYPGADSFQVEDTELFYGRDFEAEQLITMVLMSPFSLLHARSAAGKTSLLNAKIIPQLEGTGLAAVRVLPQNHPVHSVRASTLQYLLPPPAGETRAIRKALKRFRKVSKRLVHEAPEEGRQRELVDRVAELQERATLGDLRRAFRAIGMRFADKRKLIRPFLLSEQETAGLAVEEFGAITPYFSRFLRGSLSVEGLAAHIDFLDPTGSLGDGQIDLDTPVGTVRELFASSDLEAVYRAYLDHLYSPYPGLQGFFTDLSELFEARQRHLGLVLILDQFEELFTRFRDPREAGARAAADGEEVLDYQLRDDLFRELEVLAAGENGTRRVAIRWLISMRDDYIAELDAVRQFAPRIDDSSFHLTFLSEANAAEAIRRPAKDFRYEYDEECYERIIGQLLREGRYVEPAHIQIVCSRLWNQQTRDESAGESAGDDPARSRIISLDTLRKAARPTEEEAAEVEGLNETRAILRLSFGQNLREIQAEITNPDKAPKWFRLRRNRPGEAQPKWQAHALDPQSVKLEILEMLEPLITAAGTRNIMSRAEVAGAPFRQRRLRRDLLDALEYRRIVRVEKRLGGFFVEIAHEFLIDPIRHELARVAGTAGYSQFREAMARLESAQRQDFRRRPLPLGAAAIERLAEHAERLDWRYLGAELLLRSALLETESPLARGSMERWVGAASESEHPAPERILARAGIPAVEGGGLLALDELEAVKQRRFEHEEYEAAQLETLFASQVLHARPGEEQKIDYWLRRLETHGT